MREPKPTPGVYGVLAEFDRPEALVEAAKRTRDAGYTRIEGFSPFPIEEMPDALGLKDNRVPFACLGGAIAGGLGGYLLQVYTNIDFPLNVGGRPLIAPQAFALITFELTVLGAVLAAVLTMLLLNKLPRLNHPIFEAKRFHLASTDKFFLVIQANDPRFDEAEVTRFLKKLKPIGIEAPPFTEEPE